MVDVTEIIGHHMIVYCARSFALPVPKTLPDPPPGGLNNLLDGFSLSLTRIISARYFPLKATTAVN